MLSSRPLQPQDSVSGMEPEKTTLDLENFLPYQITMLASHIAVTFARHHAQHFGLSIPEWRIVATLGRYGTLTSGSLTDRTGMDKAKVSRAVSRLTASKLIQRRDNENDLRSNLLCLTEQGQSVHDRIVPIALDLEQELTSALNADELGLFKQMMGRLEGRMAERFGNDFSGDAHI